MEPDVTHPFDQNYLNQKTLIAGLDAAFAIVKPWAEGLHGPLSAYALIEGYAAESGRYLNPEKEPRPLLCDGKRQAGGAIDRFLTAHWQLLDYARDPIDGFTTTLIAASMGYGAALCELSDCEVPGWPDLSSPAEFTIPNPA